MIHFDLDIRIDNTTADWGPYLLRFPVCSSMVSNDGLLPYDSDILSTIFRAFEGKVDANTDLSIANEIVGLFDSSTDSINNQEVVLYLKHPGAAYKNIMAGIIMEVLLASGQTKSFYGYYINIGWQAS